MGTDKQKMHSGGRSGVGTGTTSLLMIFTVLCFATLAMLSLSTAASQQRIQQRGTAAAVNTAAAKGEAAAAVSALDAAMVDAAGGQGFAGQDTAYYTAMEALATTHGFTADSDTHTLTLVVAVDSSTELVTDLQLLPPGQGYRYQVAGQVTRLIDGWTPGGGAGVWQG